MAKEEELRNKKEPSQPPLRVNFIQKHHLEDQIIVGVDVGIQT